MEVHDGSPHDGFGDEEVRKYVFSREGNIIPVSYTHLDVYKRQVLHIFVVHINCPHF